MERNGFSIEKELGAGAFGVVYKANKNGTTYAIKKIEIRDSTQQLKIMKEVKSLERLSSSNVVKYYECFQEDNALWIVLEFCDGGDLNKYILRGNGLSYDIYLSFVKQIIAAIDYIHSQNIIHRDIKPDNIMIVNGQTIKLSDFGLSRIWESFNYQSPYYSFSYSPNGPPYYSAPEVINDKVTVKSDIFSLGCVIMAVFARTTVDWFGGSKLLAPYVGIDKKQISDSSSSEKRDFINEFVKLPYGGSQKELQDLVEAMVEENWRKRPTASETMSRVSSIQAGCIIL